LTGLYERQAPDGSVTNRYNYRVVRLWTEDPEQYVNAGVALVPLAPLADVKEESLPGLVQRMAARFNAEPPSRAAKLWTATYLLMGLRYSEEIALHILEGVANMQQSATYQAILREGRNEGLIEGRLTGERQLLIRQGTERFGQPDAATVAAIEAIEELNRLESLGERILEPNLHGWDDLLRTP
jgi:predicted transposase YdaD